MLQFNRAATCPRQATISNVRIVPMPNRTYFFAPVFVLTTGFLGNAAFAAAPVVYVKDASIPTNDPAVACGSLTSAVHEKDRVEIHATVRKQ